MSRPTTWTIIELDGPHLSAVRVVVRAGAARVKAAVHAVTPGGEDATAQPAWGAAVLRDAGFSSGRGVLVVPRAAVVFKVLQSPAEGLADEERLAMVALQLGRQLTFPESDAAVDSVMLGGGRVVAAAAARVELNAARALVQGAGVRVMGTDLRSAGIAAMCGEQGDSAAIAPGHRTTEIVIGRDGLPLYARSIDAEAAMGDPEGHGPDRVAARAAVEFKRTLMSARAAGVIPELKRVVVLGDDDLAERVRAACELELGLSSEPEGPEMSWPDGLSPAVRRALVPLVGVALRRASGLDGIDFVKPHRAPDRAARRRQLVLAAVFALVCAVGAGGMLGQMRLRLLDRRFEALTTQRDEKREELRAYYERHARVGHAEVWVSAGNDWIEESIWVTRMLPTSGAVTLEELSGKVSVETSFSKGPDAYPGRWSVQERSTVRVSGRAESRDAALALRRDLLGAARFAVLTQGPDAGDRFTLDLVGTSRREVE